MLSREPNTVLAINVRMYMFVELSPWYSESKAEDLAYQITCITEVD